MKIIAEKINGTRQQVAKAIVERNIELIQRLACRQAEAGAAWIDINAGTHPDREPEDLVWLAESVQAVTEVPLCLDSTNPKALAAAIAVTNKTPMINSVSGEPSRIEGVLPLAAQHGCPTVALCMDDKGIPVGVEPHLEVLRRLAKELNRAGISDDKVYVDPLVMTVATDTNSVNIALETIRAIRQEFPAMHITSGLSNVSFGLPVRSLVNRTFVVLAMAAGMDSAIADPLDADLRASVLAAELLLGKDKHCLNYIRAHRAGLIQPAPKAPATTSN